MADSGGGVLVLVFLLFGIVLTGLLVLAIVVQLRLDVEKGQRPLLTKTSSGTIGRNRYSGPFIRLSLYDDFLVIRCLDSIVLPYAAIDRVNLTAVFGIFDKSVSIIHHSNMPTPIIIKTGHAVRIKQIIETRLIR